MVRLELDEQAEILGGLLLKPDGEIGTPAQLVGLGEEVTAAGGQGPLAQGAFQPEDDLVEQDDGSALLRPFELRGGARELFLGELDFALYGLRDRRARGRLGGGAARGGEDEQRSDGDEHPSPGPREKPIAPGHPSSPYLAGLDPRYLNLSTFSARSSYTSTAPVASRVRAFGRFISGAARIVRSWPAGSKTSTPASSSAT